MYSCETCGNLKCLIDFIVDIDVVLRPYIDSLSLALAGTGVYPSPLVVNSITIVALFREKSIGYQNFCCETRLDSLVVWK